MRDPKPRFADPLDRKVQHLFDENPAWWRAFITWRMACVGCDLAGHHTARQALEIYGIDEADFRESFELDDQSSIQGTR